MITRQDITNIFSAAYAKAALSDNCDMRLMADLFESIRVQLDIADPYLSWDLMILERMKFDNDFALEQISDLKESYFNLLFENLLTHLDSLYKTDQKEALSVWTRFYADAAVHYRDDLVCMLCYQKHQWGIKDAMTDKYSKLSVYIRENRWPDAFPLYEEIAANGDLTAEVRACAEIALLEIILYYYPENSRALKHLDNARILLPDHFLTKRAEAVYYLKTGEIQKARNSFLQVIAMKPGDYVSFDFIGDCFLAESMLESAESWYNEAIQKNFIQADPYKRLLNLYGEKTWFKEKEPLMGNLLQKIEKRQGLRNTASLIEKGLATENCFINLVLYESYRDVAAAWFTAENFEKSEEWYIKAIKLQPGVVTAILDLAYVKLAQKQPDKALDYFLQALGKDKDHFDIYWGLAFYYEDHGQKEEAVENFMECLRLRPSWSDWINNFIGNLHYSLKEYKESETFYRKAVDANGNYPVYRQNLAGALEAQADQLVLDSKHPEAEKLYLSAAAIDNDADRWNVAGNFYFKLKRWQDAADCYDKAIALRNSDPILHENRGLAYENMQDYHEAENAYKKALEFDKVSGRIFNRLGVFYYERKKYDQSVDFYKEALEREPKNPIYLENICLAYEQANLTDLAEPYYLRLIEVEPDRDDVMNLLGILYYKRKNFEKALEYYNKALAVKPGVSLYYENIAAVYDLKQEFDEAVRYYELALQINPENAKVFNAIGVNYFNRKQYEPAIVNYRKAVALENNNGIFRTNLGMALMLTGQREEAMTVYLEAVKLLDDYYLSWNDLGVLHYEKGNHEQAIECYNKSINLQPNDPVLYSNLALALNALGKTNEALDVTSHPLLNDEVRKQVESMLQQNLPFLFEAKK